MAEQTQVVGDQRDHGVPSSTLKSAERKAQEDAVVAVGEFGRPNVANFNAALSAEQRHVLKTQQQLLNGLYQAKLHVGDQSFEMIDVQILHNMLQIADVLNKRAVKRQT